MSEKLKPKGPKGVKRSKLSAAQKKAEAQRLAEEAEESKWLTDFSPDLLSDPQAVFEWVSDVLGAAHETRVVYSGLKGAPRSSGLNVLSQARALLMSRFEELKQRRAAREAVAPSYVIIEDKDWDKYKASLKKEDGEGEGEEVDADAAPARVDKAVELALTAVFTLIEETATTHPDVAMAAVRALHKSVELMGPADLPPDSVVVKSLVDTLTALVTNGKDTLSSEDQSLVLSMQLSIALASGSFSNMLSTAHSFISATADSSVLVPESLRRVLNGMVTPPNLGSYISYPHASNFQGSTKISLDGFADAVANRSLAMACDGQYVYLHGPFGLAKVCAVGGTRGGKVGEVVALNADFRPAAANAWLGYIGGVLLFHDSEMDPSVVVSVGTEALVEEAPYVAEDSRELAGPDRRLIEAGSGHIGSLTFSDDGVTALLDLFTLEGGSLRHVRTAKIKTDTEFSYRAALFGGVASAGKTEYDTVYQPSFGGVNDNIAGAVITPETNTIFAVSKSGGLYFRGDAMALFDKRASGFEKVFVPAAPVALAATDKVLFVVGEDGKLYGAGPKKITGLDTKKKSAKVAEVDFEGDGATDVAVGGEHIVAVVSNTSVIIKTEETPEWCTVIGVNTASCVAVSGSHVLIGTTTGEVHSVTQHDGELNTVSVSSAPITCIEAGESAVIVVDAEGAVYAGTSEGEGTGVNVSRVLEDADVVDVAVGDNHYVAVCKDGSAYAWGGDGEKTRLPCGETPEVIESVAGRCDIVSAVGHTTLFSYDATPVGGKDLLGCAPVCNGATLAFSIPKPDAAGGSAPSDVPYIFASFGVSSGLPLQYEELTGLPLCMAVDSRCALLWVAESEPAALSCYRPVGKVYTDTSTPTNSDSSALAVLNSSEFSLPVGVSVPARNIGINVIAAIDAWLWRSAHPLQAVELVNAGSIDSAPVSSYSRVDRYSSTTSTWHYGGTSTDAITFTADTDIEIVGIGWYGSKDNTYTVKAFVNEGTRRDGESLTSCEMEYACDEGATDVYDCLFDDPVMITAGEKYTIGGTINGSPSTYGNGGGTKKTGDDGVEFTFSYSSGGSDNGTSTDSGQVPSILYRLPSARVVTSGAATSDGDASGSGGGAGSAGTLAPLSLPKSAAAIRNADDAAVACRVLDDFWTKLDVPTATSAGSAGGDASGAASGGDSGLSASNYAVRAAIRFLAAAVGDIKEREDAARVAALGELATKKAAEVAKARKDAKASKKAKEDEKKKSKKEAKKKKSEKKKAAKKGVVEVEVEAKRSGESDGDKKDKKPKSAAVVNADGSVDEIERKRGDADADDDDDDELVVSRSANDTATLNTVLASCLSATADGRWADVLSSPATVDIAASLAGLTSAVCSLVYNDAGVVAAALGVLCDHIVNGPAETAPGLATAFRVFGDVATRSGRAASLLSTRPKMSGLTDDAILSDYIAVVAAANEAGEGVSSSSKSKGKGKAAEPEPTAVAATNGNSGGNGAAAGGNLVTELLSVMNCETGEGVKAAGFAPATTASRILSAIQTALSSGPSTGASGALPGNYLSAKRFTGESKGWGFGGTPDAVCVTADAPVYLYGFGCYGGTGGTFTSKIELREGNSSSSGDIVASGEGSYDVETAEITDVLFDLPFLMEPGTKYCMVVRVTGGDGWSGNGGNQELKADGVTFKFDGASGGTNGTSYNSGQMPTLLYGFGAPSGADSGDTASGPLSEAAEAAVEFGLGVVAHVRSQLDAGVSIDRSTATGLVPAVCANLAAALNGQAAAAQRFVEPVAAALASVRERLGSRLTGGKLAASSTDIVDAAVVESSHPYPETLRTVTVVDFGAAAQWMAVCFDPLCETVQPEDYVQLFADRELTQPLTPRYCGATGDNLAPPAAPWPKGDVIVPGSVVVIAFTSGTDLEKRNDATRFGFRAEVTGYTSAGEWNECPEAAVERELVLLSGHIATALYIGGTVSPAVLEQQKKMEEAAVELAAKKGAKGKKGKKEKKLTKKERKKLAAEKKKAAAKAAKAGGGDGGEGDGDGDGAPMLLSAVELSELLGEYEFLDNGWDPSLDPELYSSEIAAAAGSDGSGGDADESAKSSDKGTGGTGGKGGKGGKGGTGGKGGKGTPKTDAAATDAATDTTKEKKPLAVVLPGSTDDNASATRGSTLREREFITSLAFGDVDGPAAPLLAWFDALVASPEASGDAESPTSKESQAKTQLIATARSVMAAVVWHGGVLNEAMVAAGALADVVDFSNAAAVFTRVVLGLGLLWRRVVERVARMAEMDAPANPLAPSNMSGGTAADSGDSGDAGESGESGGTAGAAAAVAADSAAEKGEAAGTAVGVAVEEVEAKVEGESDNILGFNLFDSDIEDDSDDGTLTFSLFDEPAAADAAPAATTTTAAESDGQWDTKVRRLTGMAASAQLLIHLCHSEEPAQLTARGGSRLEAFGPPTPSAAAASTPTPPSSAKSGDSGSGTNAFPMLTRGVSDFSASLAASFDGVGDAAGIPAGAASSGDEDREVGDSVPILARAQSDFASFVESENARAAAKGVAARPSQALKALVTANDPFLNICRFTERVTDGERLSCIARSMSTRREGAEFRIAGLHALATLVAGCETPATLADTLWFVANALSYNGSCTAPYPHFGYGYSGTRSVLADAVRSLYWTVTEVLSNPVVSSTPALCRAALACLRVRFSAADFAMLQDVGTLQAVAGLLGNSGSEGVGDDGAGVFGGGVVGGGDGGGGKGKEEAVDEPEDTPPASGIHYGVDLTSLAETVATVSDGTKHLLTDNSTETFWEPNGAGAVVITLPDHAGDISEVAVYVDNSRDRKKAPSALEYSSAEAEGSLPPEDTKVKVDSSEPHGWVSLRPLSPKHRVFRLTAPKNKRIRQIKVLGFAQEAPNNLSARVTVKDIHALARADALVTFELLSTLVFGGSGDNDDLKEFMVGKLGSIKKGDNSSKAATQTAVVELIMSELASVAEAAAKDPSTLRGDEKASTAVWDPVGRGAALASQRDGLAFRLINMVTALAGSDAGAEYVGSCEALLCSVLGLLATGTPRIQRACIDVLKRVIPQLKPERADALFSTQSWIANSPVSAASLGVSIDTLSYLLLCAASGFACMVRGKELGLNAGAEGVGLTPFLAGGLSGEVATRALGLLRILCYESEQWKVACELHVVGAVMRLGSLQRLTSVELLGEATAWFAFAALAVLRNDAADKLNESAAALDAPDFDFSIVCENHDDGITKATRRCGECGLSYCEDCDRILHLPQSKRTHARVGIVNEGELNVSVSETSTRAKLSLLMVTVDAESLKVAVQSRQVSAAGGSNTCRFCKTALDGANRSATIADGCCNNAECEAAGELACPKMHVCGHACGGVKGEATCLPCLHGCGGDGVAELTQDADDMCHVCWTDMLVDRPAVRLDCGHVFHYECVDRLLESKWYGARITFGWMGCPLCKALIASPVLADKLAPLMELYEKVRTKSLLRIKYMNLHSAPEVVEEGGAFYNDLEGYAMDRLAYYLCFRCKEPYFGGEKVCDVAGEVEHNPEELVCGGCIDLPGCEDCPKHGREFLEWKCRYCCSPSVWFCGGTTHYCDPCHSGAATSTGLPCPVGSGGVQLSGPCPLNCSSHPPSGEEYALGCSICRNAHTF